MERVGPSRRRTVVSAPGGQPPRGSRLLLTWAARMLATPDLPEDAAELFDAKRVDQGRWAARWWYRKQALASVFQVVLRIRKGRARDSGGHRPAVRSVRNAPKLGGAFSWLDVKLGIRMFSKHPVMTLVSGFAISITVAAALGAFGVFQDFFFRPTLPLPDGDRVVSLGLRRTDLNRTERRVLNESVSWREGLESVQEIGLWRELRYTLVSPDGRGELIQLAGMTATGFTVAGVPPLHGRPLMPDDERPGAEPVIVIGYDEWVNRFGADPDVVGQRVRIGYDTRTIVGVMPEGFGFPYAHSFWIPPPEEPIEFEPFEGPPYHAFGRLAPGVTRSQAQAEMTAHTEARARLFPGTHEHVIGQVMAYTDPHTGMTDVGERHDVFARGVFALLSLIVLIPFANVAILVYARTATRAGELTIRTALGASRMRIVGQLFAEAMVLASLSAAVGVAMMRYAWDRVENLMAEVGAGMPFWSQQGQSLSAALYVVVLTVLAAAVAGAIPGIQVSGKRLHDKLKRSAGRGGLRLGRGWTSLVVVQVAITTAFLPTVGWVAWDAFGQGAARASFEVDDLLGIGMAAAPRDLERDGSERLEAIAEVARRLEADPRVSGVSMSDRIPDEFFSVSLYAFSRIDIAGVAPPGGEPNHRVGEMNVEPGFFEFLDVDMTAGREFVPADFQDEAPPVVVNQAFVDQQLSGANAIGRYIRDYRGPGQDPAPWREIIGVVSELAANPFRPDVHQGRIFGPLDRSQITDAYLTVRAPGGAEGVLPLAERIAVDVDPGIRTMRAAPFTEPRNPILMGMRLYARAMGLVLLSVLLLCTAAVFALMSFNVTQRLHEIGVRVALGASPGSALGHVMLRSAKQLAIGAAIGAVIVFITPPFSIDGLPVDRDPQLLASLAGLMVVIGMAGAVMPARRGLTLEPTDVLREE